MVEIEILMTHEMCKEDMQDSVLGPVKNLFGYLQKERLMKITYHMITMNSSN